MRVFQHGWMRVLKENEPQTKQLSYYNWEKIGHPNGPKKLSPIVHQFKFF
jgi:NADH:ubiquinone oxidoreductase subunit